ncbi:hypothetical protein [Idiomarina xiamenensis]|uniref:Lipoprotein n=1 Tax=Idiomarina xiamenensis 10-D-4 TaxID=740709 RepID=K2K9H1_9GAMM|nr:hypothetical protein [Idiomarina xiamenensis]EKE84438.1 hypothetical protein A10D4_05202 [Idiomarina xiamenensis 10-D-4]
MKSISKAMVLVCTVGLLSGCEIQRIDAKTAPNLEQRENGPLPQSLLADLERDIRSLVTQVHRSQVQSPVNSGGSQDKYRIEAQLVQQSDSGYVAKIQDRFVCSEVQVTYRFNFHDSYLDSTSRRRFISNTDQYQRIDKVCDYQVSGQQTYQQGLAQRL